MKTSHIIIGISTIAFILTAYAISEGLFKPMDTRLMELAPLAHLQPLNSFSVFVAYGLGTLGLTLLTLVAMAWGFYKQQRRGIEVLAFGGLMFTSSVVLTALKYGFERARPEFFPWLAHADGFSFPSGHTSMNLLFWGMLANWLPQRWMRVLAWTLGIIAGPTRVIVGVHWPSDILGGWCLAALLLGLWYATQPQLRR